MPGMLSPPKCAVRSRAAGWRRSHSRIGWKCESALRFSGTMRPRSLHRDGQIHRGMDAARDLVGSGRVEDDIFGGVARVHGKARILERQWAFRQYIAGTIGAQADRV